VSILGGEELKLSFVMRKAEDETPAATRNEPSLSMPATAPMRDDRGAQPVRRWYKSPWLWVSVGALLAGGSVAAGLLLRPDAKVETRDPVTTDNTPTGGVVVGWRQW
jgi:hypothetical protein